MKPSTWLIFSPGRIKRLLTGVYVWVDADGNEDVEHILFDRDGWRHRWAIDGIHSYTWWWVRRFGQRSCGCTYNPITRKRLLTTMDCEQHSGKLGQMLREHRDEKAADDGQDAGSQ